MSIFGQGIWLLSEGEAPFVTIRNLNIFADHASYILFIITPLYKILSDIRVLILLQSMAVAFTAWFIFKYAMNMLKPWVAYSVLIAFLFYPALQFTWLEYFHPVVLALPFLILLLMAIESNNLKYAIVWSVMAIICKENVSISIATLGLFALITQRFKIGIILILFSALYTLLVLNVVIPSINPEGYQYSSRLWGDFANSTTEAIIYLINPINFLDRILSEQNLTYFLGLFSTVAFIPLLAPIALLSGAQLSINLVSSWTYAHEIQYHYAALVIPFVFIALVRGLKKIEMNHRVNIGVVITLLLCTLGGQVFLAPNLVSFKEAGESWKYTKGDDKRKSEVNKLLANIEPGMSVTAHYRYLAHLVNRKNLYMFPEIGPEKNLPDAILIDMHVINDRALHSEALNKIFSSGLYERREITSDETALYILVKKNTLKQ